RLLLGEEAHRLAQVCARSPTERHDGVDTVAPSLLHRTLHQWNRNVRFDLCERRRERGAQGTADSSAVLAGVPTFGRHEEYAAGADGADELADPANAARTEDQLLRVAGVRPLRCHQRSSVRSGAAGSR